MAFLSILAGLQELALRTLQELADTTTACSNAMNALDEAKADKVSLIPLTIPVSSWKQDLNGYYIDLSVPGITADDCVAVLIAPESKAVAEAAVLTNTTESKANSLRLRAWRKPTAAITAHYYIVREDILMALGPVSMGGNSYVLPPATNSTLGGIIGGDGIVIDENGKASVVTASASVKGLVKPGADFNIGSDGSLSLAEKGGLSAYPVGSIYQSTDATSPAALFGGTWEQIASERVLMGASSTHAAGTTAKAGLPNITGKVPTTTFGSRYNETSGAFSLGSKLTSNGCNSNSYFNSYYAFFDASGSNAIYGRSSTVQPAAYYVHIWRRTA